MNKQKRAKRIGCMALAFTMAVYTNIMAASVAIPPAPASGQPTQAGQPTQTAQPTATNTGMPQSTQATVTGPAGDIAQTQPAQAAVTGPAGDIAQTQPTQANGSVQNGTAAVKPVVQSQGAVLYDVTHNQFLFEQNADTHYFPASITKLMTALLVLEKCNLNDTVTFSNAAVTNLESGAVTLKTAAGDKFSVKDCLYGLLLKSANEIANGLAEHVSGSVGAFADLMNQKAASLGCTNTHFANPNGLNDANHFTTARDMALIAKAAFENPTLCQIVNTISYDFPATASVPTVRKITMRHKMLNPADPAYYYQGIVGGKTGYTSLAGNTLVTCAERNGVRLITVILKGEQSHYQDTKALLDYGFATVKAGNTSGSSSAGTSTTTPGAQVQNANTWIQDNTGWRFVKADGSYAKNETLTIGTEVYCFKADTYMATGWYQVGGAWCFFRPSGGMAKSRWIETNSMWYYVDANGALFTSGVTPDGYKVDENGVWIK
ncbi:MAG: serine hydrolase [Clostridium sp.]